MRFVWAAHQVRTWNGLGAMVISSAWCSAGPGDGEAALVRHLHHLQRVALDIGHVEVGREPLHVDGELEFHSAGPPEWVATCARSGMDSGPAQIIHQASGLPDAPKRGGGGRIEFLSTASGDNNNELHLLIRWLHCSK